MIWLFAADNVKFRKIASGYLVLCNKVSTFALAFEGGLPRRRFPGLKKKPLQELQIKFLLQKFGGIKNLPYLCRTFRSDPPQGGDGAREYIEIFTIDEVVQEN